MKYKRINKADRNKLIKDRKEAIKLQNMREWLERKNNKKKEREMIMIQIGTDPEVIKELLNY